MRTQPTRDELIQLCHDAIVPQERWNDRDSAIAHRQLGECLALLRAGCEFSIEGDTTDETIWVRITYRGFAAFEYGDDQLAHHKFYVPTRARLDRASGEDWY